ncbi:LOW QUALITY PROTEIN: hypothetical protein CRUP_037400, partial [Coryphaenoides rupestris]
MKESSRETEEEACPVVHMVGFIIVIVINAVTRGGLPKQRGEGASIFHRPPVERRRRRRRRRGRGSDAADAAGEQGVGGGGVGRRRAARLDAPRPHDRNWSGISARTSLASRAMLSTWFPRRSTRPWEEIRSSSPSSSIISGMNAKHETDDEERIRRLSCWLLPTQEARWETVNSLLRGGGGVRPGEQEERGGEEW